jgi:hypothetical protein
VDYVSKDVGREGVFTYSSSLQVVHKSFEGSLVTVTDDVIFNNEATISETEVKHARWKLH